MTLKDMKDVIANVEYKDWNIGVYMDEERPYLQVKFYDRCRFSQTVNVQTGRKWFLSFHMCKNEIVNTAFKAILAAEEHEVRERFRYRDQVIYGPHFDVDALAELCAGGKHLDYRKEVANG